MYVSRVGLAEYQFFPNYRNYNDLNQFGDNPRRFIASIFLPRTNVITAVWKDPDNYANELTRTYALSYQDSEVSGVGSSVNTFLYLGQSNVFLMDSICLIRANHATGNGGAVRFNTNYPNAGLTTLKRSNASGPSLGTRTCAFVSAKAAAHWSSVSTHKRLSAVLGGTYIGIFRVCDRLW